MSETGSTVVQWTYGAVVILLLLLVEDSCFWFVPSMFNSITHPLLQLECSEVKPGESREQALKIMHRWTTPAAEGEGVLGGEKPEHTMAFGNELMSGTGTAYESCTVQLDPSTGMVKAAKYKYEDYGEFGPLIE